MEEIKNDNLLTVVDENGNDIECEILFTFDSDEYKKNYVVYMPIGEEFEDEDGMPHIHVSSFTMNENGEGGDLEPIEDEAEWDMIEEVIESFMEDQEAEDGTIS